MNAFATAVAQARTNGEVIDLSCTSFAECGWKPPTAAIRRGFAAYLRSSGYDPDPAGLTAARAAVAAYYSSRGIPLQHDSIILSAGTSEAFSLVLLAATEPGDGVLLPLPGYPLFEDIVRLHNRIPQFYTLRSDGGCSWRIDSDSLRAAISPRTRICTVVSPNNPTGWAASREELRGIIRICAENKLNLVWDEVFGEYLPQEKRNRYGFPGDAAAAGVPLFLLGGTSKLFAAPELKCSWTAVAGADALQEKMLIINDLFLSTSGPTQHCLPYLFGLPELPGRTIGAYTRERAAELPALLPPGWEVIPPEGGIHAVIRAPQADYDDESAAVAAAVRCGVALQPGYLYGFDEHPEGRIPHWVVSLLLPRSRQRRGWEGLGLIEAVTKDQRAGGKE